MCLIAASQNPANLTFSSHVPVQPAATHQWAWCLQCKYHDPCPERVLTLPLPLLLTDQQTAAADSQGPLSGFPQRGDPDRG